MGFWVVGSIPTSTIHNELFQIFPWRTWKILSPVYPGNETAWIYWQVRPYIIRPTCYPAVSGGKKSVIRLSLSKLLVNLLQVVKRTNTPLKSLTHSSSKTKRTRGSSKQLRTSAAVDVSRSNRILMKIRYGRYQRNIKKQTQTCGYKKIDYNSSSR